MFLFHLYNDYKLTVNIQMMSARIQNNETKENQKLKNQMVDLWTISQQNRLMIKDIQKQLKSKVNRSEYLSGLSGKLSLSQIPSLGSFQSEKQNENPNSKEILELVKKEIKQVKEKLQGQSLHQFKELSEEINIIRERIDDKSSSNEIKQQILKIQEIDRNKWSELEAFIFQKSDRSELNKLFTLNQLLVIEIEQAKQHSKSIQSLIKQKGDHGVSQLQQKMNKLLLKQKQQRKNEINTIHNRIDEANGEVEKIIGLMEMRQQQKQQKQYHSQMIRRQLSDKIGKLQSNILRIDEEAIIHIKQLNERMNIYELKETQLMRTSKGVESFGNEINTLRNDLHLLSNKINTFPNKTQAMIKNQSTIVFEKVTKEIEGTCEELMRKVLCLIEDVPTSEQMYSLLQKLQQKNTKSQENIQKHQSKLSQLSKKLKSIQEKQEEDQEKTEQQIFKVGKVVNEGIKIGQLKEILGSFMTKTQTKQQLLSSHKQFESKVKNLLQEQNKINEILCSQNIVGKWFWTTGTFHGGNLITWDKQIVNTLPENFHWSKGVSVITISNSGYYKLELGFYSKKKPTIQIIVNGQTIVSAVNSNSYVLHHSSGKLKNVGSSQISGLTYVDFFLIPEGSRLAISYNGEFSGEGFLSIQRF